MSNPSHVPQPADRPGLTRLISNPSGELLVTAPPEDARNEAAFTPFLLPLFPLSQHCWLSGLGAEFRRRHGRCLAALLVLDCRARRWVMPVIPDQACGADGTCWTLDLGDGIALPSHRRVAGSYQTARIANATDAAGAAPAFDGVHLVHPAGVPEPGDVYCFLHAQGHARAVPPREVLADDWDQALADAADRMAFD